MAEAASTLRIVTWNIGGGYVAGGNPQRFDTRDLAAFAEALGKLAPDIICLQEVHTPADGAASDCAVLQRALELPYRASAPCDTQQRSHLDPACYLSLAILSRWPIGVAEYHQLPNPRLTRRFASGAVWESHDKGLLRTTIDLAGRPIAALSCHLLPFSIFERDALEPEFAPIRAAAESYMLSARSLPAIVAGDFNHADVPALLPAVAADLAKTLTGVATEPLGGRELDHILVSPEWLVVKSGVVEGRADHFLVYADLALA